MYSYIAISSVMKFVSTLVLQNDVSKYFGTYKREQINAGTLQSWIQQEIITNKNTKKLTEIKNW